MRDRIKAFFMTPVYLWRSLKMKSPRTVQTLRIVVGSMVLIAIVAALLLIMASSA